MNVFRNLGIGLFAILFVLTLSAFVAERQTHASAVFSQPYREALPINPKKSYSGGTWVYNPDCFCCPSRWHYVAPKAEAPVVELPAAIDVHQAVERSRLNDRLRVRSRP